MNQVTLHEGLQEPFDVSFKYFPHDVVFRCECFHYARFVAGIGELLPHTSGDIVQGVVLPSLQVEQHAARSVDGAIQDMVVWRKCGLAHDQQGRTAAGACQSRRQSGGLFVWPVP